jgi:hypothetical protein
MSDLISEEYRSQLLAMNAAGAWGGGGASFAKHAYKLVKHYEAKTILDYGCGPGTFKKALAQTDLTIIEYDPGIPGKEALPQPAEIVICGDVLEHIEPDKLPNVLAHIHSLTLKAAALMISLRPAEKRLPDGRNAHLIIDNAAWWFQQISKFDWKVEYLPIPKRPDIGRFLAVKV